MYWTISPNFIGYFMNDDAEKSNVMTRRGLRVYASNPSISNITPMKIAKKKPNSLSNAYMIAPGTGEVLAKGGFSFIEEVESDPEAFVKVYLQGIRKHAELSAAGAMLFEFIYCSMSGSGGKDRDIIPVNHALVMQWKPKIKRATYYAGMKELIDKGFLFRSLAADSYYVNVTFMFNGSRINLIKSYSLKSPKKTIE